MNQATTARRGPGRPRGSTGDVFLRRAIAMNKAAAAAAVAAAAAAATRARLPRPAAAAAAAAAASIHARPDIVGRLRHGLSSLGRALG